MGKYERNNTETRTSLIHVAEKKNSPFEKKKKKKKKTTQEIHEPEMDTLLLGSRDVSWVHDGFHDSSMSSFPNSCSVLELDPLLSLCFLSELWPTQGGKE